LARSRGTADTDRDRALDVARLSLLGVHWLERSEGPLPPLDLSQGGGDAASHQIPEHAGLAKALVFATPCRECAGKLLVVQITEFLEISQDNIDILFDQSPA
jgi:hypothetical protein